MNKPRPIQEVLLVIMRVTLTQVFLMILATTLVCAAPINGQGILDRTVSIKAIDKDAKYILDQIEKQAAIEITYNAKLLKSLGKISVQADQVSIGALLETILSPGIEFNVIHEEIVLRSRPIEMIRTERPDKSLLEVTVKGRVTDEAGQPLPGVNVIQKGTTNGTSTDADGTYSLVVSDTNVILIFSFIGYQTSEVPLNGSTTFDHVMQPDIKSLQEVVVVGYGERKKENYTGAVSTVNTKEIVQAPVANISNALTGRLSGLIGVQRNGEPGQDGSQLLIRGLSSLGDNSPLVVIDGIPRGDFSQLDPNEIESLTLLKDPASAAVFGVRAANGVILVTTRRGKAGKSSLSFSVRSDWQKPTRLPEYLDSYGYASLFNEALLADGKPVKYTPAELELYRNGTDPNGYPNTDWLDETFGGYAPQQQYNLSLSGGAEKIKYFVSLGHVDQKGLYANSAFKRYNLRSNIDADVTPTTRISIDLGGRIEDRDSPSEAANQLMYYALFAPPIYPAYFTNGLPGAFPTGRNPAERAKSGGYNKNVNNVMLTTLTLNQQLSFVKGLSIKGVFAYDRNYSTQKNWRTPYKVYNYDKATGEYISIQGDGINTTSLYEGFYQSGSLTLEAHVNYARTFGDHEVSALLLYTQNQFKDNWFYGSRDNFISNNLDQLLAGNPATQLINGGAFESGRLGYVGRLNYSYQGKYLMEGNFRYDGVSTFAPGQQYGFFPSISVGWKISEESFIRDNISVIDYFKMRASYGSLGNDRIEAYRFLPTYSFGSGYVFGEGTERRVYEGLYPDGAADPSTTWETARSLDIGFDGSIAHGLLGFEFDYFYKRTSNILIQNTRGFPQTIGQQPPTQNLGIVDNKGFEFSLSHENSILNDQLTYFVKANCTYTNNEIIETGEQEGVNPNTRVTGRSINQFFGYKAIGLFNSQEEIDNAPPQPNAVKPGDIRYADLNGRDSEGNFTGKPDGKVDADDMTAIGYSPIPKIIFGISGGAKFKGFDLNFLLQGAGKVSAFVTGELAWPFYNGSKALVDHTDYWTPENTDAKYPRLTENPSGNNIETSSYWLRDASYIRLKNLELGYTIPATVLSKIKMTSARIYVSGQNLLTIDKLDVIDPEGPGESGNYALGNSAKGWFYPQQKVYAIGINLTF